MNKRHKDRVWGDDMKTTGGRRRVDKASREALKVLLTLLDGASQSAREEVVESFVAAASHYYNYDRERMVQTFQDMRRNPKETT